MKKWAIILSLPLLVLAIYISPIDRLPLTCQFLAVTGYPCPSCGMTRSVTALVRMDPTRALRMNPLGFPFVAALVTAWVCAVVEVRGGKRLRPARWALSHPIHLTIAVIVVFCAFGVGRIWLVANGLESWPGSHYGVGPAAVRACAGFHHGR